MAFVVRSPNVEVRASTSTARILPLAVHAPPPTLNLLVIRSKDIERAADFYREMGLSIRREAHGSGPEHYTATVDGRVFEIYPQRDGAPATTGVRFGFAVDDVDGVVALLRRIGAEIVTEPKDSPWGRRAVVKDPDGHVVELVSASTRA